MVTRERDRDEDQKYHRISEETAYPSNNYPRPSKASTIATATLAVITFIEFCIILKILILPQKIESFATGFATDIPDATGAITLHPVRFTSPLKVDENGTFLDETRLDERLYTGTSPVADQAWEDLVHGRYIRLRESEVAWLDSDKGSEKLEEISSRGQILPQQGVYGGVNVMHSLHCLNMLRINMHGGGHMDTGIFTTEENKLYLGYCVDQLRQSLMCSGDLTPVTLRPVHLGHRSFLLAETQHTHTCRNYEAIRDWATQRAMEEGTIEV